MCHIAPSSVWEISFLSEGPFFFQIEVSGNVTCRLGMLLLTAANVRVLGGQVTQLEEQNSMWKLLHRDM